MNCPKWKMLEISQLSVIIIISWKEIQKNSNFYFVHVIIFTTYLSCILINIERFLVFRTCTHWLKGKLSWRAHWLKGDAGWDLDYVLVISYSRESFWVLTMLILWNYVLCDKSSPKVQAQVDISKDMYLELLCFNISIKMYSMVENWVPRMPLLNNRGLVTITFPKEW